MQKYLLFAFICLFLSQVLWAVPTDGLVGLWYFNGNASDDSEVNTNNGTVNGATLTTDRFGNANSAYYFDGNDYIKIGKPIPSTLQMSTAFAISAWIKPTQIGSELGGIVASQYDPTASGYSMQMEYRSSVHGGYQNGVHFQVGGGSYWTNSTEGSTATTMSLNQWHHIVVMAQVNSVYAVYIDGSLVTNWTAEGNIAYNANCELLFGANSYNGSLARYFYGNIDDIAIYNKVLTQSEITQLYTATAVPEPGAILFLGIGLLFARYFFKA